MKSDEQNLLERMLAADLIYDVVMIQLDFDDDPVFASLVEQVLRKQTVNNIISTIWKNLDAPLIEALKLHLDHNSGLDISISHEELLMNFALRYPVLSHKINQSLAQFFRDFIAKFTELS